MGWLFLRVNIYGLAFFTGEHIYGLAFFKDEYIWVGSIRLSWVTGHSQCWVPSLG